MTFQYVLFDGTENHPQTLTATPGVIQSGSDGVFVVVPLSSFFLTSSATQLFDGSGGYVALADHAPYDMNWDYLDGLFDGSGGNVNYAYSAGSASTAGWASGANDAQTAHSGNWSGYTLAVTHDGYVFSDLASNTKLKAGSADSTPFNPSTSPLSITISGTWVYPYPFIIRSGYNIQISGSVYITGTGKWIDTFSYAEGVSATPFNLTSLSFNDLIGVCGNFNPSFLNGNPGLTSLGMNTLTYVGGNFAPSGNYITSLSANSLIAIGGNFSPAVLSSPSFGALNFNSLILVGGTVGLNLIPYLTTVYLPSLQCVVGQFSPNNCTFLNTINCPALQYMGTCTLATMSHLATVNFPAMVNYSGAITITTSLGAVSSVTLGTIGTLKKINGSVNIATQKLTQATVDGILALIASLDGTNGTTSWGSGKTLTINGGTNSAPSTSGSSSMATIVARGGTVTHN